MTIKVTYNVTDVYVSETVSATYINVSYETPTGGGAVWGDITGTLSNQLDLQAALDAKYDDPTGTTAQYIRGDGTLATFPTITSGTVTSVGLTMPSAFNVANSPITSSGTLAVTGAGTAAQYIRGDGQLATFPSSAGGGSSVNYYLNGSVNASVGGYKQLDNVAIVGGGTDFTLVGNGLIAQFLTNVGNPNRIQIPGGAWNFEMFFQVSSSGGNQKFYVELHKYDGTTFTLIASSSTVPEEITGGTSIDLYLTSLAVPTTALLATDRLAIRVYIVNNSGGRTVTLHTENNTLCEIITTFAGGVSSLNGLTANTQYLATGTSGTDFNINSLVDTHTFNLPTASATNRGALSTADWSAFNSKIGGTGVSGQVAYWSGTGTQTGSNNLFWDNTNARLGIGTNTPSDTFQIGANIAGTVQVRRIAVNDTTTTDFSNIAHFNANIATTRVGLTLSNSSLTNWVDNFLAINVAGASHASNFYFTNISGKTSDAAYSMVINQGTQSNGLLIGTFNADPIYFGTNNTARVAITANGRLLLGSTIEGTQTLQVTGTSLITGVSTFGADMSYSRNTNAINSLNIINTTDGTDAQSRLYLQGGAGAIVLGQRSNLTTDYKIITANDGYLFKASLGDIAILNDVVTGKIKFAAGAASTAQMTLHSTGNLSIGSTTDTTQRLQVTGDVRVSGNIAQVNIGDTLTSGSSISFVSSQPTITGSTSLNLVTGSAGQTNIGKTAGISNTSGGFAVAVVGTDAGNFRAFNPASGTATYTVLRVAAEINQTGGANGITRGLYVNPTLTAAADWRSIEWSNNTGWGLYGAGTSLNYLNGFLLLGSTTSSGERLQVTGTMKVTGASTFTTSVISPNITSTANANTYISLTGGGGAYIDFRVNNTDIVRMGTVGLFVGGTTVPTAFVHIGAGTTAKAQIRLASSTAPTTPNDGDIWFDGTNLLMRIGGLTKTFTLI